MDWLAALLPILWSFIQGKKGQSGTTATQESTGTTTNTTETPAKVAFDPMYYLMSGPLAQGVMGNYRSMAGAGMPGGVGAMGDIGLGNVSQLIEMINQSFPDILKAASATATPATPAAPAPAPKKKGGENCTGMGECEEGYECRKLSPTVPGHCVQVAKG